VIEAWGGRRGGDFPGALSCKMIQALAADRIKRLRQIPRTGWSRGRLALFLCVASGRALFHTDACRSGWIRWAVVIAIFAAGRSEPGDIPARNEIIRRPCAPCHDPQQLLWQARWLF